MLNIQIYVAEYMRIMILVSRKANNYSVSQLLLNYKDKRIREPFFMSIVLLVRYFLACHKIVYATLNQR